ncbi:hypothetical protein [Lysobacter antibioticus]|uniref:hypothetical protein n=1 Tax=Lysobacter antibioticus TaxID=84531 RepID=UPI0007173E8D|nr:hypothetical protein [Lysobacter antibioticus]
MKAQAKMIIAFLLAMLFSSAAWAESLVSPPLFSKGGPSGGTVTCRIFQFGSTVGEPLRALAIYTNTSAAPVPLAFNTCNVSSGLRQNENCSYGARIAGNLSYTCVFISAGGAGAQYTGTIEIQDSQFNVLEREAMRVVP